MGDDDEWLEHMQPGSKAKAKAKAEDDKTVSADNKETTMPAEPPVATMTAEERRVDIDRCTAIAGSWLAFSLAKVKTRCQFYSS